MLQLHALLELAMTHIVAKRVGNRSLTTWILKPNVQGGRASKMGLGEELSAFDAQELRVIRRLSTVRNRFTHNVRMTEETLIRYINGLEPDHRQRLEAWTGVIEAATTADDAIGYHRSRANLRAVLWQAVSPLLVWAYDVRRAEREGMIANEFGLTTEDGVYLTSRP